MRNAWKVLLAGWPPLLRLAAGIEKNVVVIGNDNYFEIWAEERLEQSENLDIDGAFSESLAAFMN